MTGCPRIEANPDINSDLSCLPERGPVRPDQALVRDFARAVGKPGNKVLLITRENLAGGWCTLDEAVHGGYAFAVQVAGDILAVDVDKAELVAPLDRLVDSLRADHLHPVTVASGRPNHRHMFARIQEIDLLDVFRKRARGVGLDVRRTIRPPMSPHRHGLPVTLLDPDDPAEALAALIPPKAEPRRPLSSRMEVVLRDGNPKAHGYHSRSDMVQGLALAAFSVGWTENEFYSVLIASPAGDKPREILQQRGYRDARRYVSLSWTKAKAMATRSVIVRDREDVVTVITTMKALAASYPWSGIAGTTDRLIIEAHLQIAARAGRLTHHAAVRDVADATGFAIGTVSKAHGRLRRLGWLRLTEPAKRVSGVACLWTLRLPRDPGCIGVNIRDCIAPKGGCPPVNIQERGGVCKECSPPRTPRARSGAVAHDVWRRAGLGKARFALWCLLCPDVPSRARELAQFLGRKLRGVQAHLAVLKKHGLAVPDGVGWRRGKADLDAIALRLGVAGAAERQRQKHEVQRARFHALLERAESHGAVLWPS